MAQPRPPASQGRPRRGSLPAVAGWQVRTLAGAAWPMGDPKATIQPDYPKSGRLCPGPHHDGCVRFWTDTRTTRSTPVPWAVFHSCLWDRREDTVAVGCSGTGCVCMTATGTTCSLPYRDGVQVSSREFVVAFAQVGCPVSGHTTPSLPLPCVRASATACGAVTVGVTCCCVCTLWLTVPCVSVYVVVIRLQQCVMSYCAWLFGHLQGTSSPPELMAGSLWKG